MREVEKRSACDLFSNSDFLLPHVQISQINEGPRKLRLITNNLKRTLYPRRTYERRAQNFMPTHQLFHRLSQPSRAQIAIDANGTERTEGFALSTLLYRPETSLLR